MADNADHFPDQLDIYIGRREKRQPSLMDPFEDLRQAVDAGEWNLDLYKSDLGNPIEWNVSLPDLRGIPNYGKASGNTLTLSQLEADMLEKRMKNVQNSQNTGKMDRKKSRGKNSKMCRKAERENCHDETLLGKGSWIENGNNIRPRSELVHLSPQNAGESSSLFAAESSSKLRPEHISLEVLTDKIAEKDRELKELRAELKNSADKIEIFKIQASVFEQDFREERNRAEELKTTYDEEKQKILDKNSELELQLDEIQRENMSLKLKMLKYEDTQRQNEEMMARRKRYLEKREKLGRVHSCRGFVRREAKLAHTRVTTFSVVASLDDADQSDVTDNNQSASRSDVRGFSRQQQQQRSFLGKFGQLFSFPSSDSS